MAHDTPATVSGLQIGMSAKKFGDLGLHGLGQQGARPGAQHLRELVVERSWLNQDKPSIPSPWRNDGSPILIELSGRRFQRFAARRCATLRFIDTLRRSLRLEVSQAKNAKGGPEETA